MEYLSNKELYFSTDITDTHIQIHDEDYKHIVKVMRHLPGDKLFITDGKGIIYETVIEEIKKDYLFSAIEEQRSFQNRLKNISFCLPKLKSPERFEFALEKCTELGITNFIIFNGDNSVSKGEKVERWNKIVLAAMKQSLNCHLPKISIINKLDNLTEEDGIKILFEQNSSNNFSGFVNLKENDYYFIFGPEGGLSNKEMNLFETPIIFNLAENRLRAETAIIKAASMLK